MIFFLSLTLTEKTNFNQSTESNVLILHHPQLVQPLENIRVETKQTQSQWK